MTLSILVPSSEISTISRHCILNLFYQYPIDTVSSPISIPETGNQDPETSFHEEQLKECGYFLCGIKTSREHHICLCIFEEQSYGGRLKQTWINKRKLEKADFIYTEIYLKELLKWTNLLFQVVKLPVIVCDKQNLDIHLRAWLLRLFLYWLEKLHYVSSLTL